MIVTWSKGIADECMAEDMLTELTDIVRRHPWFHARSNLLLRILNEMRVPPFARILDAGCGWGVTLEKLEEAGYRAAGLDISERILQRLDRPGRELIEADLGKPLPDGVEPFDVVLALDVIEHLDDDRAAVARFAELTRPGGLTIISVPALPDLFSEFDEVQGHRRRYLPDTLRAAFTETGLQVERIMWWGSWMVPFFRLRRRRPQPERETPLETYRRHLIPPRWPFSWIIKMIFAYEQERVLSGKTQRGTSLFAVARRQKPDDEA